MPPKSTAGSVPPPPASAADEMLPAEPPRPLAVPVPALPPATATGGSIPAGLRMLSEAGEWMELSVRFSCTRQLAHRPTPCSPSRCVARYGARGPDSVCARVRVCHCVRACVCVCVAAASMPSADDRAGDPGQAPAPWWPGMPGAVPPGLAFNPTPGSASGQTPPSVPAGSQPPGTVWNADLGVAFTALWAAGFQAGQQMANPAVPPAVPGAVPGAVGAPGAPGAVAPTTAPPVGKNSQEYSIY